MHLQANVRDGGSFGRNRQSVVVPDVGSSRYGDDEAEYDEAHVYFDVESLTEEKRVALAVGILRGNCSEFSLTITRKEMELMFSMD